MDMDLWGSSYHQVAHESSYSMLPGWQCDFYIGYGYDVIEEDALNEKSCIQVLRILITKADSEIDELEQDLVSLQSQLALAEHEEWPELCCNALTEKINCLDISIRSLKNTDENDVEVQLLMHKEPAERVHEIVRVLLTNYFQEKDEQPFDAIALDSSSNVPKHAASLLDENEMLSNFDSSISIKEETKESSITGKCTGSNLSLKLQEKKSNYPETIKPEDSTIKNSSEDALPHAIDHFNKKKKLSSPNLKIMGEEIKEHNSTPTVDDILLVSSSNSEGERTDHGKEVKPLDAIALDSSSNVPEHAASLLDENEMSSNIDSSISIKEETKESSITGKCSGSNLSLELQEKKLNYPATIKSEDSTIKNSSEDAFLHTIVHSNKKKKLSSPNLKIMGEEIEEHNSIPTVDDIVLGSSSNSEGERTDHGKEVKHAKTIGKGSSSDSIRDVAGRPLGKCDLNVGGNEEVREYNSAATDKLKILNSSSNPKGEGNLLKTDKRANAIVTSSSAEALRHATGLNRRGKGSDSDLGALGQTESGNSDLELKLRDFVAKIERKECVKGLKIAPTDKIDALGSSVKTNCKRKNPSQKVVVQEAGFTKTGRSSSTSLLEMQDQRGQEASKLQMMEEGKSPAKDIQKVEVATIGKNSILNVSLKPQKQKGKRKIELDTPQFQEPAFPFIRVVSDSSISKSKSKQKSGVSTDIVVFNQSLSRKVPKRLIHSGQCEAKEQSFAHDDGKSFVSGTRKKRRRTNFPSTLKIEDSAVHMEVSNLPGNANDNGSKENLQIIKFYSDDDSQSKALVLYDNSQSKALVPYDDSQSMASVPLPYTGIELMKLKLIDLRAIAKEQKLIKYHKLPKQVLVKLLVDHLGIHSGQCEAKEQSVAHDDSKSFVSGTRKKRRTNFPSTLKIEDSAVHMELSNLPGNATDNGRKENLQIIKFYSDDDSQSKALVLCDNSQSKALVPYDDSQSMASVPLPYTGIDLMKLKLIDLRAIAKEQKLMEYHKLPKQVLVKQLVDHLGGLGYC